MKMFKLPNNWAWSTVGSVTNYIQRGKSPKYAEQSDLPVINQKCIRWNELQLQHLKYVHPDQMAAWDESRHIRAGDILWNSTGTGTVGRAYLVNDADCNPTKVVDSHVTIVRATSGLDPRYLFNWIKSPAVQSKIEEMCDGTTNQIELSRAAIAETAIPVAPREEQARIADQLDTLLARIQACNDHLDAIPGLLKRFRQAVLNAAIRGDLVQEQFDGRSQSKSIVPVPDLCLKQKHAFGIGPFGSDLKVADYRDSGVPLIFVRDIRARKFGDGATKFVSQEKASQLSAHIVLPGDLLVTKMGDPPGDPAIYPSDRPPAVMTADVVRMRVDPDIADARYVGYWFESEVGRSRIATITAGVAQQKISLERLRTLQIELPCIEEQRSVVRQVEFFFEHARRIDSSLSVAGARAQRLNSLTLAKAFRGELVPQDPNDEPAGILLARLASELDHADALPKTRKVQVPSAIRALKPLTSSSKVMPHKSRQDEDVKGQPYLAGHLRRLGQPVDAKTLYEASELPVADFYKQLAWEISQGHVNDANPWLESALHAA